MNVTDYKWRFVFQTVLWWTCVLLLRASSAAELFAGKARFGDFRSELKAKEMNLVNGPEPTSLFLQKFGNPSNKERSPNDAIKDVLKSLYRYEARRQFVNSQRTQSPSYEVTNSIDTNKQPDTMNTPVSPLVTEDLGRMRSAAPPVLEDIISEIVFHPPSHVEVDKSQRFTHSIRYGYGAP